MEESNRTAQVIRFGVFEVNLRAGELRTSGLRIKLQEQPFQILAMLLEHPGEVVTREELRQRLWPADTFVDFDHSLNTAIKKLRQALGDSAEKPHFVETLSHRGYRFIAPVDPPAPRFSPGTTTSGVATCFSALLLSHFIPAALEERLEPVGGAVPLNSAFYVVRPTDEEFQSAIARRDSIVLVKGARQVGKTSLLDRGLQQAREGGAKVVLIDFQKFNAAQLESADSLYLSLAEIILDQLDLDILPNELWNPCRGPSINFERFLRREVMGKIASPLVWGVDEVDRLFTCNFGSEVFGLFRSWHNERSLDPTGPWQRLTLVMAYATEAHLFITDMNQSPFNVGTRLTLEDFTFEQVAELNRRYGSPLGDQAELERYFFLVGGHPYLVRCGLHEMSVHGLRLAGIEAQADYEEGIFGNHLRRIVFLLRQDPALCEAMRGVLKGGPSLTAECFYRLRSAGFVSGDAARDARLRCQLYAAYLEKHLR